MSLPSRGVLRLCIRIYWHLLPEFLQQKAEKLIKQGFKASLSEFQSWLYLPKLLERYQSEVASALQQGEFKTWETGPFQQAFLEHQQAVVQWVNQACEFFNREQPDELLISFPGEPKVIIPNQPITSKQSSGEVPVAIATGLGWFLEGPLGAAVVGGATYLLNQNEEKPESSASYLNQVSQAYAEVTSDYLNRFSTQALSTLHQYEEIADKVIIFKVTEEPSEITSQHHQLQLLHTLLNNLNQELELVSAPTAVREFGRQ